VKQIIAIATAIIVGIKVMKVEIVICKGLETYVCKYDSSLYELSLHEQEITAISGLQALTELTILNLNCNKLRSIDLGGLSKLEAVYIMQNNLIEINLTGLSNLLVLDLDYNNLTSINLDDLKSLNRLYLSNNNIAKIDLSKLISLDRISLEGNPCIKENNYISFIPNIEEICWECKNVCNGIHFYGKDNLCESCYRKRNLKYDDRLNRFKEL